MLPKSIVQIILRIAHAAIKLGVPVPLRVYNVLGHDLKDKNRLSESMHVFLKLKSRFPKKSEGYEGIGKVAMLNKDWSLAAKNWAQVLETTPDNDEAIYNLGMAQTQMGLLEQAKITFLEYIQSFPGHYQGYEGMAFIYSITSDKHEMDKWLAASIANTNAKSSYFKRARLLVRHAQFEEGLLLMDSLLENQDFDEDSLTVKADLLLMASKYTEAVGLLQDLYDRSPSHKVKRLYAQALIGAKRYDEASTLIDQISNLPTSHKSLHSHHPEMIINNLKTWQKYHLEGRPTEKIKIFGIGLSRTGTSSLTKALQALGFDTLHFINPITKRILDLEDFFYFDAFTDSPVAYRFEELYVLFPNAKFIYTERDLKDWVRSNSDLYKPMGFSTTKEMKTWLDQTECDKFGKLYQNYHPGYTNAYRSLYADFPSWEDAYHAFDERVTGFFEDKPQGKLLKINICNGEGWDKLCSFLEVPKPDVPFPHRNKLTSNES